MYNTEQLKTLLEPEWGRLQNRFGNIEARLEIDF